jgi:hypothetical protein
MSRINDQGFLHTRLGNTICCEIKRLASETARVKRILAALNLFTLEHADKLAEPDFNPPNTKQTYVPLGVRAS